MTLEDRIILYLADELSPEESRDVEQTLEKDPSARALMESYQSMMGDIAWGADSVLQSSTRKDLGDLFVLHPVANEQTSQKTPTDIQEASASEAETERPASRRKWLIAPLLLAACLAIFLTIAPWQSPSIMPPAAFPELSKGGSGVEETRKVEIRSFLETFDQKLLQMLLAKWREDRASDNPELLFDPDDAKLTRFYELLGPNTVQLTYGLENLQANPLLDPEGIFVLSLPEAMDQTAKQTIEEGAMEQIWSDLLTVNW